MIPSLLFLTFSKMQNLQIETNTLRAFARASRIVVPQVPLDDDSERGLLRENLALRKALDWVDPEDAPHPITWVNAICIDSGRVFGNTHREGHGRGLPSFETVRTLVQHGMPLANERETEDEDDVLIEEWKDKCGHLWQLLLVPGVTRQEFLEGNDGAFWTCIAT